MWFEFRKNLSMKEMDIPEFSISGSMCQVSSLYLISLCCCSSVGKQVRALHCTCRVAVLRLINISSFNIYLFLPLNVIGMVLLLLILSYFSFLFLFRKIIEITVWPVKNICQTHIHTGRGFVIYFCML